MALELSGPIPLEVERIRREVPRRPGVFAFRQGKDIVLVSHSGDIQYAVLEVLDLMGDDFDRRGVDGVMWMVTTTDLQHICAALVRFQAGLP